MPAFHRKPQRTHRSRTRATNPAPYCSCHISSRARCGAARATLPHTGPCMGFAGKAVPYLCSLSTLWRWVRCSPRSMPLTTRNLLQSLMTGVLTMHREFGARGTGDHLVHARVRLLRLPGLRRGHALRLAPLLPKLLLRSWAKPGRAWQQHKFSKVPLRNCSCSGSARTPACGTTPRPMRQSHPRWRGRAGPNAPCQSLRRRCACRHMRPGAPCPAAPARRTRSGTPLA